MGGKKTTKSNHSRASSRNRVNESEVDFEAIVIDAFRNKFEFVSINQIEKFIAKRSGLSIDGDRRKIIRKFVGDEFYKGCIAIRTLGRGSK